jgi:hypothetical protein
MRELAETGYFCEAVDYAQPHALRLGDAALHRELTQLRRQAADEAIRSAQPRPDWPPQAPDPFPDCDGIPEIDAADLNAKVLQGAILHHGSLLVRGALERREAVDLAADIDQAFRAHDAYVAGTLDKKDEAWYSIFNLWDDDALLKGRFWSRQLGGIFAADSPVMFSRLADLYERRGIAAVIREHLGERPLLSVGKTVLRKVTPKDGNDFHQDGAFLGADVRTMNVWIALSDCGTDSPGLEVVDRRLPHVVETGTEGASFDWSVGRPVAERAAGGRPFARPEFKAGDALLFDQLMLHSTSYHPAMTKPRYALEAWFFAPSAYTEEQIALML